MLGSGTARVKVSASGGGSPQIARSSGASAQGRERVWRGAPRKWAKLSRNTPANAGNTSAVTSAKMDGAPASKPVKVAGSASRSKSAKIAKASSKPAKIVIASAGKSSGKSQKRNVAGLMKSTRTFSASPRGPHPARPTPLSRAPARVGLLRSPQGSSPRSAGARPEASLWRPSANPYGAFVRSASFVN